MVTDFYEGSRASAVFSKTELCWFFCSDASDLCAQIPGGLKAFKVWEELHSLILFFVDCKQVWNYFIVLYTLIYNPKAEHLSGLCGPCIIFVHLAGLCLNELFMLILYSQTTGCSWNNKAKTVLHKWSIHFYSVSLLCVLITELWYLCLLYIWSFSVLTQVLKAHRHSYILTLNYCTVLDISRHWHC